MKLKLKDFEKVGYSKIDKYEVQKKFNENLAVEIFILEDRVICTMLMTCGNIPYVEIQADAESTVEEVEGTIQEMYKVLVGMNSKLGGYLEESTKTEEKK